MRLILEAASNRIREIALEVIEETRNQGIDRLWDMEELDRKEDELSFSSHLVV